MAVIAYPNVEDPGQVPSDGYLVIHNDVFDLVVHHVEIVADRTFVDIHKKIMRFCLEKRQI